MSTHVYKTIGDVALSLEITELRGASGPRPAIVFFFGGGWKGGSPMQFHPHAAYLASRGMVAARADYRVLTRHGTSPFEAVADARRAMRFLYLNAGKLNLDAKRIAAGGGSAGGHLAANTAFDGRNENVGDDLSIDPMPAALALFNPVLEPYGRLLEYGDRAGDVSPSFHVKAGFPPTILFHGMDDKTVPYEHAVRFSERMKAAENRCDLHGYENKAHGFFNYHSDRSVFADTLKHLDRFLVSIGFLTGRDTVDDFMSSYARPEVDAI